MKLFVRLIVVPFAVTAVHQLALTWNKPRKLGGLDEKGLVIKNMDFGLATRITPSFPQMDGIAMGTYVKMEAYTVTSEFSAWIIGPSDVVKQMAEIAGAKIEQDRCMFAMMPDGNPFWTIGLPFIRQYCHIYDIGGKRIGFAKPRSSPEPPTVIPRSSPEPPTKAPETSTQPPQPEPTPHKSGTIISSFTLWILLFLHVIIHFS
ncbi:hypothetical protein V3C99_015834 [Haemonchus contortus]